MVVPNEKYEKWKLLGQRGDAKAIADYSNGKYKQISVYKALQHGNASIALQDVIDSFYNDRVRKIKQMATEF